MVACPRMRRAGSAALKRGDDGHRPAIYLAWTWDRPRAQEIHARSRDPGPGIRSEDPKLLSRTNCGFRLLSAEPPCAAGVRSGIRRV